MLDNVFLGIEAERGGHGRRRGEWTVASRQLNDEHRVRARSHGPGRRALSIADQQKVEIMRALARDARLIVMDEPTAALSADEAARSCSTIVRQLQRRAA